MRKNDGFTLIEILVSIALITIMSISFLLLIANHFGILNRTKDITEEVFLAQRELEEEIDSVKQEIYDINSGITPDDPRPLETVTIFEADLGGIDVSYYETEINLNSRQYYTLVSNIKPDPLEIIKLDSIDSNLKHNNNDVDYGYATSDFSIVGEFSNLNEYKYDHLLNQVEWYASTEKFNLPMPKSESFDMNDNLEYNSYYFPVFPEDYTLVDNETVYKFGTSSSTFEMLTEFGGHHIVYTVTPAAKSGKLGEQMVSDSIFVSGLPVTENLILHLDASYIDITIPNEVQIVGDSWFVWKWFDVSSIIGHTVPIDYAQTTGLKPVVMRTEDGTGVSVQYVKFDDNQKLEIVKNTSGDLTVISVVKNRSVVEVSEYLNHGDTVLNIEASTDESIDIWRVTHNIVSTDGNVFEIGGNNMDIAEMLIYQGTLGETDITALENYITEKYKDLILVVNNED